MNTQLTDGFESEGAGVTLAYVISHIHASGHNFYTCPKDDDADFIHRHFFVFDFILVFDLFHLNSVLHYVCMLLI